MTTRQLNIKDRSYNFYNDLINVLSFEASNLKLDKKSWKDLDIYFIGYVDKKPDWSVNSVNLLYLIINTVYVTVDEKNSHKFLTIDEGDSLLKKYDQVFSGIKYHIGKISNEKVVYGSEFGKIKFLSDNNLPLFKLMYFPILTVVIRCIFKQDEIYHPQVFLDECLYQI